MDFGELKSTIAALDAYAGSDAGDGLRKKVLDAFGATAEHKACVASILRARGYAVHERALQILATVSTNERGTAPRRQQRREAVRAAPADADDAEECPAPEQPCVWDDGKRCTCCNKCVFRCLEAGFAYGAP